MDSKGHKEIGEVGIKELEKAIEAVSPKSKDDISLNCFEFGNWMTDIIQINAATSVLKDNIDPARKALKEIRESKSGLSWNPNSNWYSKKSPITFWTALLLTISLSIINLDVKLAIQSYPV